MAATVACRENMYGDITSEITSGLTGGLGVAPSANLNEIIGMFQPCDGSGLDIAGRDTSNPIWSILSAAMMFDWLGHKHDGEGCKAACRAIEASVRSFS